MVYRLPMVHSLNFNHENVSEIWLMHGWQLSFKSLVLHLLLFLTNFHTSPRPEHSERLCWHNASKRFQKGRCLVDS